MKKTVMLLIMLFCLIVVTDARAEENIPSFSLLSLGGGQVSLGDLLGKKNIFINFWASWCDACKEEVSILRKIGETGGTGTVFLGINVGDSERAVRRFVDKYHFNYLILLDKDKETARRFQVVGVPYTIVISKEGKIVYRGSKPPSNLRNLL